MLPLQGVRVVEFCQVLAGPFAGCLLADMGADVIKVESPEGDLMRQWPPILDGYSQYFASVNRNKRSIALDLRQDEAREIALQLIDTADVVMENFRPGVMAAMGFAPVLLKHEGMLDDGYFAFLHPVTGILAHDLHAPTVDAMPATFDGLLKRGYKFVTVSQLLAMKTDAVTAQASVSPAND